MHGITDEQNYVDIANAIREKNGSDTQYLPSEMAKAIEDLPNPPQFGSIGWDAEDVSNYNAQLAEDIAYSKALYDAWDANNTNAENKYQNDKKMIYAPHIDTSKVTSMRAMFYGCLRLYYLPLLDTSKATAINNMFYNCHNLKNIGGFKNLKVALDLSSCTLLTHDSLMNVINNLYDLASNGLSAQTLTLGADNLAKLTDDEKAIASNKGWTLA